MKIKSFVREVVARIKGDEPQILAEKNFRKATNAIEAQIPQQKAELFKVEDEITTAEEGLRDAKFPADVIKDQDEYLINILNKRETLEALNAKKEAIEETIKFLESLKVEFTEEVEA